VPDLKYLLSKTKIDVRYSGANTVLAGIHIIDPYIVAVVSVQLAACLMTLV
jgi:hypothetical protein